jgi:hypothetical protein
MSRMRTIALVGLASALPLLSLGCNRPEPKPVTTGQPAKTFQGTSGDPAASTETADVSMARPVLPPQSSASVATPLPAGPRVTVQYQAPTYDRSLADYTDQELAAEALARIGPPAVPSLIQALGHRDPAVRREAASVLTPRTPPPNSPACSTTKTKWSASTPPRHSPTSAPTPPSPSLH